MKIQIRLKKEKSKQKIEKSLMKCFLCLCRFVASKIASQLKTRKILFYSHGLHKISRVSVFGLSCQSVDCRRHQSPPQSSCRVFVDCLVEVNKELANRAASFTKYLNIFQFMNNFWNIIV